MAGTTLALTIFTWAMRKHLPSSFGGLKMGQVVKFPIHERNNRQSELLETKGSEWITREKKLLDKAEFLEAMIMVLNDVRMKNIQDRDYSMMEIVSDEIPHYQNRLEEIKHSLTELRKEYGTKSNQVAN